MTDAFGSIGALALAFALAAGGALVVLFRRTKAHEVTIRRLSAREQALKARFDDLFERATDVMVVHDRRGHLATMNRAGEHLTGYPREEARALDTTWLFSDDYLEAVREMLGQGADSLPRVLKTELKTRRGGRVPVEAHVKVLVADGQIVGVSVVARNLSEQDHLEAQLRQAQTMEAVGRLATGIAHDFNNLVTVLLGYGDELVEVVSRDSPLRKPVEEMRRAAHRASTLAQELLAFSRRTVAKAELIDVNATVTNLQYRVRRALGPEISLELKLGPEAGSVIADPTEIADVLKNLAANARDAMPNGGSMTIETARVERGGAPGTPPRPYVMLAVSDTGVGIPPELLSRVTEPLFTTKEAGKGSGLGLSTVEGIVRQRGGYLTIESVPGEGATFRVFLPQAPPPAATASAPASADEHQVSRGSGVVLVVEDDPPVRRLLTGELRRRGFTVLEAEHGGDALKICREHRGKIDVLLTDVVMPRLNGVELAAAVAPLRPDTKVLFMSGHPERAGEGMTPEAAQAANLILKPFTPETVVARINALMTQRR